MDSPRYSKSWLVTTGIARGLLEQRQANVSHHRGILWYLDCSRGVIQKALATLQDSVLRSWISREKGHFS